MDEKGIVFIIQKKDETAFAACKKSIDDLKIPEGYHIKLVVLELQSGVNLADGYNSVNQQVRMKYKIYVDEKLCFVNEDFIQDMLDIFAQDDNIGVLGIAGEKQLTYYQKDERLSRRYGGYYIVNEQGDVEAEKFRQTETAYAEVQCVDDMLVAVKIDLEWKKNLFAPGGCGRISASMEALRRGYKVVVPRQKTLWCLFVGTRERRFDMIPNEQFQKEYASYLSILRKNGSGKLLYSFGCGSKIQEGCMIDVPERVYIGDDVLIEYDAYFKQLNTDGKQDVLQIIIETGCRLGKNCMIAAAHKVILEHHVCLADNVYITDVVEEENGLAFGHGEDAAAENKVIIGHGTHIGPNVVVQGNVRIGYGCRIRANSVIAMDIPNYCVVEGNPARIVKFFDRELGKWLQIENEMQLKEFIDKRKKDKPILTIGIPTYNRSYYLNKCLRAIYDQIGDDDLVEVFVSDNCSEDDTRILVEGYAKRYKNLRYHKNSENIGARNFEMVWGSAKGEYVVAVGDDDYFTGDILYQLMSTIYQQRDAALIMMLEAVDLQIKPGRGIDEYVQKVSYVSTYISALVMKQKYFQEIENKHRYSHTSLNQVYLQLEILSRHPQFVTLNSHIFGGMTGEWGFGGNFSEKDKACLGKVFIQEYFDLLALYLNHGLSEKTFREDKKVVWERMILPWLNIVTLADSRWKIDSNIDDIFDQYYKYEDYYETGKQQIKSFKQRNDVRRKKGLDH